MGFDCECREADEVCPTVTHTSELVERHRITILAKDLPTGAKARCDVAQLHAEAYARARGFDITGGISIVSGSGAPAGAPGSDAFNGVEFEVMVGKGDLHMDQRVPGLLDRWRWSGGAFEWWRAILNRADGRQGRVLARLDDRRVGVRPAWRGADALSGGLLGGAAGDGRPPWVRRSDGDDSEGE